jgi:hypothetical protein
MPGEAASYTSKNGAGSWNLSRFERDVESVESCTFHRFAEVWNFAKQRTKKRNLAEMPRIGNMRNERTGFGEQA